MSSPTFSIFIPLNYNDNEYKPELDWTETYNKRFKQILDTSSLYAATFTEVNDIDEGRYNILQNINKNIVQHIFDEKETQRICCFSLEDDKKFKEDLMWGYYANGGNKAGVRINFKIDKNLYDEYTHKVIYSSKHPQITYENGLLKIKNLQVKFENNYPLDEYKEQLNKIIKILMTRKKTCWIHEQEHRAIFNIYENQDFRYPKYEEEDKKEHYRFPIKIEEIILSRRFCKINEPFSANEHIKGIVEDIKNKCPKNNLPKIKVYSERYADKPIDYKNFENKHKRVK